MVNSNLINKKFFRPARLDYLMTLASVSPSSNKHRRALYFLSGGDFITAYLLSNGADEIIMLDRLPFYGATLSDKDYAEQKQEYYYKKYELDFSVEPDLLPETGCLQYLLWELEAMGVSDITQVAASLAEDSLSHCYTLTYQLPCEPEKRLLYCQIKDACYLEHYPEELLRGISRGIDCLIRKAAVKIEASKEVSAFFASSMDEQGVMFIDDGSRKMLDDINTVFCPVNESAISAVREFETSHSILFGYNPVSIYQSISARREWETARRYRQDTLPRRVIFINSNPSPELDAIKSVLETGKVEFILAGEAEGADMLSQHYPELFFMETAYSPDSLVNRWLTGSKSVVYILGDDENIEYFKDIEHVRYFVVSSVNYPYFSYPAEDIIPLSFCDEEKIPEHERIFTRSFDSNCFWLKFHIFKQINPNDAEAEISMFARLILSKYSSSKGQKG
ncbi:hypothetical protein [Candidatus Parabeggiatoa sp. HSG14]|uniref:hypothetical protein n=1 Tax=Candidatus Parabeggiatoa sp. HSG14 TaxID=3055593 RepID=UPI0025A7E9A1|nr:hypothetical protein [Thiotrichales bacterium HSG14]